MTEKLPRRFVPSARLFCCLLVHAAIAAACAPEPDGPRETLCAGSGCSERCRSLEVERCDTREKDCQSLVFESVRCVRGSDLTALPRTEFVPQTTFSEPHRDELEPAAVLAAQVWATYVDEGLRLVTLIDEQATLASASAAEGEATGGVQQGGVVQISEDEGHASWWAMRLLAHEYVHAQQEHDYGGLGHLYGRYARSNVTSQGIQAFIEGEAELYSWLTHAFMREVNVDPWELDEYFDVEEKSLRSRVAKSPSPWGPARQWQHYTVGARVLYNMWQSGRNLAVRSMLHQLQPDFGAWASGFSPRRGPRVSREPVCVPEGTRLFLSDSLGPSGVFALLIGASQEQAVKPTEEAWQLAMQLSEDQLRMYGPSLDKGISQAQWLAESAEQAMCDTAPAPAGAPGVDAGATGVDAGVAGVDAGARPSISPNPGRKPKVDETDVSSRLVPGGPVWLSWAFGFETASAAERFAALCRQLPHLHVELEDDQVTLRATQQAPNGLHLSLWASESRCEP